VGECPICHAIHPVVMRTIPLGPDGKEIPGRDTSRDYVMGSHSVPGSGVLCQGSWKFPVRLIKPEE
jgi:hypothetical protein